MPARRPSTPTGGHPRTGGRAGSGRGATSRSAAGDRSRDARRSPLDTADALREVASPVRDAIVTVVAQGGEMSIREIARALGRRPATLYRHVDRLLEVGLLREAGTQTTATRSGRTYRGPSRVPTIPYRPDDPEHLDALCDHAETMLRQAGRELGEAFAAGDARVRGVRRDAHLLDVFGWLDDEQLRAVNEHLDAIREIMSDAPRRSGARLVAISAALRPKPVLDDDDDEA